MTMFSEERPSDSPYIETVCRGWTTGDGTSVRPAESHWHMVIVRVNGVVIPLVVGSLPTSGVASWGGDAEILWIKFKVGMFMPQFPARTLIDREVLLPDASSQKFWLHGSAWQFPSYDNVETFINRLVRDESLVHDPVVSTALLDLPQDVADRTIRHRFLQTTGMTQNQIRQILRAQKAAAMIEQGIPILDTVFETGYFDQPHLTKSLKRFVGKTPAQLLTANASL
ncbi:MAG: helix-turn-helix domain-containing protein [Chloroflexi bacterium]|nr:helix-turn-helix domain-containing protein [Chloroflexota bacterium]MCC6897051.1 helix-turn-helix domain-containing protein [Anaerolineae bacterium]